MKKGTLVNFASGAYDGYSIDATVYVVDDFDLDAQLSKFFETVGVDEATQEKHAAPDDFLNWLVQQGFVRDAEAVELVLTRQFRITQGDTPEKDHEPR